MGKQKPNSNGSQKPRDLWGAGFVYQLKGHAPLAKGHLLPINWPDCDWHIPLEAGTAWDLILSKSGKKSLREQNLPLKLSESLSKVTGILSSP